MPMNKSRRAMEALGFCCVRGFVCYVDSLGLSAREAGQILSISDRSIRSLKAKARTQAGQCEHAPSCLLERLSDFRAEVLCHPLRTEAQFPTEVCLRPLLDRPAKGIETDS